MNEPLIFNALIEFFEEDDWDFQWMAGSSVLSLDFAGHSGQWRCHAQAIERNSRFVFYSVAPMRVPEARRLQMAEFIARINFGLTIGCFEMDFSDGELRLRTNIDCEGTELIPPLIRQVVYGNVVLFDYYLPGLMNVMYADTSPAEALKQIEGDHDADAEEDDGVEDEGDTIDLDAFDSGLNPFDEDEIDFDALDVDMDPFDGDDIDFDDDEDDDDMPGPADDNGKPAAL